MISSLRLAAAREFRNDAGLFAYSKGPAERLGDLLVWPIFRTGDGLLKRIAEPYMVTLLALAAIGICTFVFYPDKVLEWIPVNQLIQPWMIRISLYALSQMTLLGFGLRTFGRLNNSELMDPWNNRTIEPVSLGTKIV